MGKKILIVDDEVELAQLTGEFLERYEFKTSICLTGEDALKKINQQEEIDLILLDINLLDMNGLDIARFIRDNHLPIRILVISAFIDKYQEERERSSYIC